jgi:Protein of unknown function with PCYCGC motif
MQRSSVAERGKKENSMSKCQAVAASSFIFLTLLNAGATGTRISASFPAQATGSEQNPQAENTHPSSPRVPHAFHKDPPAGPLPTTLDPALFADNRAAFVAYAIAAKIRALLYQEPCTCGCDRNVGHESLLDCFTGKHGLLCRECQTLIVYIYEQHKAGKTAAEIRAAIETTDSLKLNLDKYVQANYDELRTGKN